MLDKACKDLFYEAFTCTAVGTLSMITLSPRYRLPCPSPCYPNVDSNSRPLLPKGIGVFNVDVRYHFLPNHSIVLTAQNFERRRRVWRRSETVRSPSRSKPKANTKSFFKSPVLVQFKMLMLVLIFTFKALELTSINLINFTTLVASRVFAN